MGLYYFYCAINGDFLVTSSYKGRLGDSKKCQLMLDILSKQGNVYLYSHSYALMALMKISLIMVMVVNVTEHR